MSQGLGLRVVLGALPYALTLIGLFSPAINGPNLWFGWPSLLVWVCLCTIVCTLVLLAYERMREVAE